MLLFGEETYAYNILKMVALSGEFPYHSAHLIGGSNTIIKRTILQMKREGYLNVLGSAAKKTIRLSTKSVNKLDEILGNGYYEHYMTQSNNNKFAGLNTKTAEQNLWRRHRLAEIYCLLENLNTIFIGDKPTLTLRKEDKKKINDEDIFFYSSKEMKGADTEQRYKIDFTRIMGMLISPGGAYAVYNTNRGLMKWNKQGEGKAQVLMEDLISMNCENKHHDTSRAIMFGKDMEVALNILLSNGGKRDVNDFELLSFDNTYNHIHYITLNEDGIYQLFLITQKGWHEALLYSILPEEFISRKVLSIDCDAYDEESKKYILAFLDGDIGRLKRFKEACYDGGNKKYEVICFDWQEDMVKKYLDGMATMMVVTQEQISDLIAATYS